MKEFTYSGPPNAFAFAKDGKVIWEGQLHPGQTVTLPEDHPQVKSLEAAEWLTPVAAKGGKQPAGPKPDGQTKED